MGISQAVEILHDRIVTNNSYLPTENEHDYTMVPV